MLKEVHKTRYFFTCVFIICCIITFIILRYDAQENNIISLNNDLQSAAISSEFNTSNISSTMVLDMVSDVNEQSFVDANGYKLINNSYYFEHLNKFPINYKGTCGLVALSMLLGYYDTFYNDAYIPQNLKYSEEIYDDDNNLIEINQNMDVFNRVYIDNYSNSIFEYYSENEMPGTTQAFHDYLFDKYLITLFGLDWIYELVERGYPMTASNIEEVLYAYLTDNAYDIKAFTKHYDKTLLNDTNTIKTLIDMGIPVLLTIIDYDYTISPNNINQLDLKLSSAHNVIAYGYKNDTFVVHMGWDSQNNKYNKVYLNKSFIYDFMAINYIGEHAHSKNFYGYDEYTSEEVGYCSCGVILNKHQHSFVYTKINSQTHEAVCSCGQNYIEAHKFKIEKFNKVCLKCLYSEKTVGGGFGETIYNCKRKQ